MKFVQGRPIMFLQMLYTIAGTLATYNSDIDSTYRSFFDVLFTDVVMLSRFGVSSGRAAEKF